MAKSSKGGDFERKICKFLTKWNGGDPKKPQFWRQPGSGSMLTMNEDDNMGGDIRSISPSSKYFCDLFSLECKNGYDDVSLDKFLKYNKSDGLKLFWLQCCGDAKASNRQPLLIYRKLGITPVWVGINQETFDKISHLLADIRYITLKWEIDTLILIGQEDFFKVLTPETIKEIYVTTRCDS